MTTLDQRILIPVDPQAVWDRISNLAANPGWQADCRSVSFLTSLRNGPGTRWRYASAGGHEYVVEITAWYDKLGYEYRFVAGAPFQENRGRIRLQEIPEGTVVQWTFSYEPGGVLGGIRDSLTTRKQIETTMVDSLRNLWRVISENIPAQTPRERKSLMRDAPDVEARAQYKPRHPSILEEKAEDEAEEGAPQSVVSEPTIAEEDTRPRVPVPVTSAPTAEADVANNGQPPELSAGPPAPSAPETLPEVAPSPALDVATERPAAYTVKASAETREEATPSVAKGDPSAETADSQSEPTSNTSPQRGTKTDTSQISVFEVFGLPKPSETQEHRAVPPTPAGPLIIEPLRLFGDTQPTGATGRIQVIQTERRTGLRLALRYESVKIRRSLPR